MSRTSPIDIVFARGVDENTDRRLLPNGWLRRAENLRIKKGGRLGKRFGVTAEDLDNIAGGSISPVRLFRHNDELCVFEGDAVSSYVPGGSGWVQRDQYTHVSAQRREMVARTDRGRAIQPTVAVSGNRIAYAWRTDETDPTTSVAVYDTTTGAEILREDFDDARHPMLLGLSDRIVLLYHETNTDEVWGGVLLNTSIGFTTPSAKATLYSSAPFFDAQVDQGDNTKFYLATVASSTTVRVDHMNASLTSTANHTETSTLADAAVAVDHDASDGALWLAWGLDGSGDIKCRVLADDLGSTLAATFTVENSSNGPLRLHFAPLGTGKRAVQWQGFAAVGLLSTAFGLRRRAYNSNGTAIDPTSAINHQGLVIASKPFELNNRTYQAFETQDTSAGGFQRTILLCDLERDKWTSGISVPPEPRPVGVFARWVAAGYWPAADNITTPLAREDLASVAVVGETYHLPVEVLYKGNPTDEATNPIGIDVMKWEFQSGNKTLTEAVGNLTLIAGSLPTVYDGRIVGEVGHLQYPEFFNVSDDASAGSLAATSTYSWRFTYEWTDAEGNVHESAPSVPVQHTMGAGKTTARIDFGCLPATLRYENLRDIPNDEQQPIAIHVWRTEASGTIYYRVNELRGAVSAVPGTTSLLPFLDGVSDATLTSNPILYTDSGEIDNEPPPSCVQFVAHDGRVFALESEDPHAISYSKPLVVATTGRRFAPAFNRALRLRLPEKGGEIVGGASMGGTLYVFKRKSIYAIVGAGFDNQLGGQNYEARALPADTGLVDARSLVETPDGLLFQALDGIHLLPRGGGRLMPVGQRIEDSIDGLIVSSATINAAESGVYFTFEDSNGTPSSVVAFYDYNADQWFLDGYLPFDFEGTPTPSFIRNCVLYNSAPALLASTGPKLLLQSTGYADDSSFISTVLETGDIRFRSLLGYCNVRSVSLVGEYRGAASVQLELARNGSTTFDYSKSRDFTAASDGDQVDWRYHPRVQKVHSYRLRLTETEASGQGNTEGVAWNFSTWSVMHHSGPYRAPKAQKD